MRPTPTTRDFFHDEIAPLIEDVVESLLDADIPNADEVFKYEFTDATDISIYIRLPRADAARVIGKERKMRDTLYHLFRAVLKNHGFTLNDLIAIGHGPVEGKPEPVVDVRQTSATPGPRRRVVTDVRSKYPIVSYR